MERSTYSDWTSSSFDKIIEYFNLRLSQKVGATLPMPDMTLFKWVLRVDPILYSRIENSIRAIISSKKLPLMKEDSDLSKDHVIRLFVLHIIQIFIPINYDMRSISSKQV